MTPDELKLYVDSALRQRDHWSLLFYVLSPLLTLLGGFFIGSYLTEKGKNTATKEDVGKITTEIARSNQHFNESLERVKADLGSRSHYSKVRYEQEMKIFQAIWPKVLQLRMALRPLRRIFDSPPEEAGKLNSQEQELVDHFNSAFSGFEGEMKDARPFYPPSIWEELLVLRNLCYVEATGINAHRGERAPQDYWVTAMENAKAIDAQVEKICEAIRTRLTQFDAL